MSARQRDAAEAASKQEDLASRSLRARVAGWFVFLGLAWTLPWNTQAAGLTSSLDRNVVPVGESVTLSLTFNGVNPGGAPNLPPIPNVQVAPNISQSSQLTIENGQQTARFTFNYTLVALQPGDVTIPAMQVPIGNQMVASQPLTLKILPANAAAGTPSSPTNLAFLRLIVPKTNVYVGEPFGVEIHLYVQAAKDVRMPQLRAEGFSLSAIPQPTQTRTQVGGAVYDLVMFRLTATAARSGSLTLGPVEEFLRILIPVNNPRRSRDPFESFFGFGGPRYQELPTTLKSEAVAMQVLPLPSQDIPESFNGAIGNYRLLVNAGPTNLGVGDPITVRIQIAGQGPLDAITLAPQPQWREFTSYPATAKLETSDDMGLQGSKTFEQVLIPQNHEIKALPPFQFSFFDPNARGYRTLTGPAIPLSVHPTATSAPPPVLTNGLVAAGAPPADDIVHIKPRLELAAGPLLLSRPWFLGVQGVPMLLWLGLLVRRNRVEALANNPRLRRQREVTARIRGGMHELRGLAEGRQSEQFFALFFRLLQEQLGERLDLPGSAITEAIIDQRLRGGQLGDAALQALQDLFQTCNLARYAPVQSSQELAALLPKLESVLRDLRQLKA
ncbi:MAG TPA: BatD family protein [Candidatus Saccharimonadales bacterium]|nr:BatD family protein [Candidatus Saccharimonadales bacterium]